MRRLTLFAVAIVAIGTMLGPAVSATTDTAAVMGETHRESVQKDIGIIGETAVLACAHNAAGATEFARWVAYVSCSWDEKQRIGAVPRPEQPTPVPTLEDTVASMVCYSVESCVRQRSFIEMDLRELGPERVRDCAKITTFWSDEHDRYGAYLRCSIRTRERMRLDSAQ